MRSLRQLPHEGESGSTLIELLVVIGMMAIIGSMVTASLVTGMRTTSDTQDRYDALAQLQKGVDRMSRELRAADPVVFASSDATTAVVVIYRDATFSQALRYTYRYCASTRAIHVRRETAPPATVPAFDCATTPVLIPEVDNGATPVFRYLDTAGVAATQAEDVFRLDITVRRALTGQQPIEVQSSVRVRNAR